MDFQLTYAQLGLLPAMFMAGLMVSCLVFNELCNYVNSFRLIGANFIMKEVCCVKVACCT
jgi:hypothetical protein